MGGDSNETGVSMMVGGCLCGSVRYVLTAEPLKVALCHCTHCQRTSGSSFSVNVLIPSVHVEIQGEMAEFLDRSDSGALVRRCFCPNCGSSLMSILAPETGLIAVKGGTLDDRTVLLPDVEFWRRSAQNWLPAFAEMSSFETVSALG